MYTGGLSHQAEKVSSLVYPLGSFLHRKITVPYPLIAQLRTGVLQVWEQLLYYQCKQTAILIMEILQYSNTNALIR